MDSDIVSAAGAVGREVVHREHQGRPARAVIATRTYPAPVGDVWDALTNGERIPRWFLPISGDLKLGGRYQLEGNAGGHITECEPPRHVAVTWEYGGNVSWVDVRLTEEPGGGTLLRLEHRVHVDDHWSEFGPGAVGVGWDLAILGLAEHLSTGEAVAAPSLMESPEGKAFMRASSDGWCRAAIASGTDEEEARAAAARTAAFYTGEG